MKLSPNLQYTIAFWIPTLPLSIVLFFIAGVVSINPFYRTATFRYFYLFLDKITRYRDNIKFVKYYYNKKNLLEMLRG